MVTPLEDSKLIEQILEGEMQCFDTLMKRHLPVITKLIRSLAPNAPDAEDIRQEVLLNVWRRLSTFRSESTFRTWMVRVAINAALQYHR